MHTSYMFPKIHLWCDTCWTFLATWQLSHSLPCTCEQTLMGLEAGTYCINITLLGLGMVNWSIGLLDPGDDNSYRSISPCTGPSSWWRNVSHKGLHLPRVPQTNKTWLKGSNSGLFRWGQAFTQEWVRVCHKQFWHHWYIATHLLVREVHWVHLRST